MKDSLFPDLPDSAEAPAAPSRKWLVYLLVAAGILLLLLPVLPGPSNNSGEDEDAIGGAEELEELEETRLLEQVVESIHPAQLGVESNESFPAEELNRWWLAYALPRQEAGAGADAHRESLQALLGEDATTLALDDVFSRHDVAHLSSALTLRLAGLALTTGLTGDHEKVTAMFYFVVRNVELAADVASLPASFPYQTLLWGRGSGDDRIWIFVEMLRQMRIDSFLIIPSDGDAAHPLVAVAVADELLLYDPLLGLPIPSLAGGADDAVLPQVAATFTEALENDAVFRQFDIEESPYPWTSDALRHVKLLVVGSDCTFSPRMEALQQKLPGQFSFIVFDGWASSTSREEAALQARVESAAEPLAEAGVEFEIVAWLHPLTQAASYDVADGLDGPQLAEQIRVFQGPTVAYVEQDEQGNVVEIHRPASRTLQDVRAEHIQADFDEAMRGYLPMRNSYVLNERSENRSVQELARFWGTICQFEVDRSDLAISGFQQYVRDYASGQFSVSANYWLAVSYAMNGEAARGADMLKPGAIRTIDPGHLRYLVDRWSRLQPAPSEDEDSEAPAETAETEVDE